MEKHLDSMELPRFFIPTGENFHQDYIGTVFAENGSHFSEGWVCCGFVSRQTPFGQGTGLGFRLAELRTATKEEVLQAVTLDHPHGKDFRPHCREVADAQFHLVMGKAIGNWLEGSKGTYPSVIPATAGEIVALAGEAGAHHQSLMDRWDEITTKQIELIAYL